MASNYRPDIDGLRAIAVLSVIFFHSGFSFFSGGYVGVDIFFVISGYLITSIILSEINNKNFSISTFYERRFRRILPALSVVAFASTVLGYLFLTPDGLIDIGKSAVATALFSSNILFYFESGYFDVAAEMKPLLHTWSLAVEEQFYIFFPLLLIIIKKYSSKGYFYWLTILILISFSLCIFLTNKNALAAFYFLPTRAWELMIGSILALNLISQPNLRIWREVYSSVGILMIICSIFFFSSSTAFPGIAALMPTLGTALIIYAGTGGSSLISSFLSLRPIVFIGLISYSLYLWHWPIIVYTHIISIKEPTYIVLSIMLCFIFLISIISWRFVELPFRQKSIFKTKLSLLSSSALVSALILINGAAFVVSDGYPNRLNKELSHNFAAKDDKWYHWTSCENIIGKLENGEDLCNIGFKSSKKFRFILWGDSHAKSLASGVDLSADNNNFLGKLATKSACPPLLLIERLGRTHCHDFNQTVLNYISNNPEIEVVILAARWTISAHGTRYKQEHGKTVKLINIEEKEHGNSTNLELFEVGLTNTIQALQALGKEIVIVHSIPEVGFDVPSAFQVSSITGREINGLIAPSFKEYQERTKDVEVIFNKLKGLYSVDFIFPEKVLCDEEYCRVAIGNDLLYRDDDHLSTFGSEYIANAFNQLFLGNTKESLNGQQQKPNISVVSY
ncbi:acyltransferase [Photobacterium sp. BZF1]|uniref:acyltransferase family protein n=1 Tax=Photobacterium sp. BZF1 TaxID=1904457 RepID=UPI001653B497|nr:acyltransferase family protein [Photobacterium sp. BZF1]MBC7006718.1 acyltransferase [Photobacterium sp. BZF1]